MNSSDNSSTKTNWIVLFMLAVCAAYLFVFTEWLFFVTKQSFMTGAGFFAALRVLLTAPLPLTIVCAAVVALCLVVAAVGRKGSVRTACFAAGLVVPAFILVCTVFLLIDNFTYTIFRFGVRSTGGALRFVYGVLILALFVIAYRFLYGFHAKLARSVRSRLPAAVALAIPIVSILVVFFTASPSELAALKRRITPRPLKRRPNIILISVDGLEAERMSLYGYDRDTTPFLRELAEQSLVCENNFPNADASGASIAAILTGKLPTQTKLVYPPDILEGEDSYQHLPGILKQHGYRTVDFSVRHYVDPIDLNMLDAFDWVNSRRISEPAAAVLFGSLLGNRSYYLLRKMRERLTERFLHAFGGRIMTDPLVEVNATSDPEHEKLMDSDRLERMLAAIDASPSPVFAHVHLMGTHGPLFYPEKQVFSAGQRQSTEWMTDFFDDTILQFDSHMNQLVLELKERNIWRNTMLIVCTDHGQKWTAYVRSPLVFRFPEGEHSGRIKENTQNLDISATILDYLDIEQPEWMGGLSILSSGGESLRSIFTVMRKPGLTFMKKGGRGYDTQRMGPPFFAIKSVGVIYCNKTFELYLERSRLVVSTIEGHTSPCDSMDIPNPKEIGQSIIDHLRENGYDVSSIRTPLFIREVGKR